MINERWAQWIHASCAKHFQTVATAMQLAFMVEGDERATETLHQWCELRIDGPDFMEIAKDQYQVEFEVNIVLSITQDPKLNAYTMTLIEGTFAKNMRCIDLHKYGSDVVLDDQSHFACAHLNKSLNDPIVINQLGKRRPDTRLIQSTIEGHYSLYLE